MPIFKRHTNGKRWQSIIVCACSDITHSLALWMEGDEFFISGTFPQMKFWKRLETGIKYILGLEHEPMVVEIVVDREAARELQFYSTQYLKTTGDSYGKGRS